MSIFFSFRAESARDSIVFPVISAIPKSALFGEAVLEISVHRGVIRF